MQVFLCECSSINQKQRFHSRTNKSDLFICSVPHNDLAIVAASSDNLRLQRIALEAEDLIGRFQDELRLNWIPKVPDQHSMWG